MLKPQVLKNGLTLLKFPKNSSRICIVGFICPTGSSVEEGYFPQGISYLVQRLFWYGTDKNPSSKSLNLTLETLGGKFDSFTNQEITSYYLTVPDYHQHKAITFLSEIIQRSYFDSRDIETEKKNIIEIIKNKNQDLEWSVNNLSISNIYANFSLSNSLYGSIESINSITQENILEYLSHQYHPQNCYLVIGGNFDNKPIVDLIEQEWSVWNPKNKKLIEQMDLHPEDIKEFPSIVYRQKGISKTYLSVSFYLNNKDKDLKLIPISKVNELEIINNSTNDYISGYLSQKAVLCVLNTLLGQGLSSRLWLKTIEEEMLFNDIKSDIFLFKQTGFLEILGEIENIQFSFGLESILSTLEAFKKTTVSINELTKAKEYLKSKMIIEQESLLESINWKIENFLMTGLNYELEDLLFFINKVESPQIRNLALDIFIPNNLAITTLGTAKETRLVDKLIRKYLT